MAEKKYYLPYRVHTFDLPFGRDLSPEDYKRETGKYPRGYVKPKPKPEYAGPGGDPSGSGRGQAQQVPPKTAPAAPAPSAPAPAVPSAPKPTGQKLVWNKQRMDFDTPEGKPAPYPKVAPKDIDIKGLSAYRAKPLPKLSSAGVSVSTPTPTPTPTPTSTSAAEPKPSGISDGLKKWASIYGPGGKKQLFKKEGGYTPSQRRLFGDLGMKFEAYDLVLDYLLSEGHAETVEEAHYVMMQLDSEYVQSIVEDSAPVPCTCPPEKPKDKEIRKPPADTPVDQPSEFGPEEGGRVERPLVPPGSFGDLTKPRSKPSINRRGRTL